MPECPAQRGGRSRRLQQRCSQAGLIRCGQAKHLGLLDGAARGVLRGGDHEIREGTPLDFRSALQERVDIRRKPGFKAGRGRG